MKKITSIFVLMIILISVFQNVVFGALALDKAALKTGKTIDTNVDFYDGKQWFELEAKYIYYEINGKEYPAYCISHGLDGVDEKGNYSVDVSKLLSNSKIWRTIINGYPYKTPQQMGLKDKYEAYFATKQAIYCVILNRDISLYKAKTEDAKKVVEAIRKLKDIGLNGAQTPESANLKINKVGSFVEDGDYYSQKYSVTSTVAVTGFQVASTGFPEGYFIADSNGNKRNSFNSGEIFKVMVPKDTITRNINIEISVTSKCKTYPIFYGKTRIANTQDYALTYDAYEDFTAKVNLDINTNTGKIEVKKLDEDTNMPLEGVKFVLLTEQGYIMSKATTNPEGIAIFNDLYQGNYLLKELSTGDNYILNSVPFEICVEYNETSEITVTNKYKKGNIKVNKIDSETSEGIAGVTFELLDLQGNHVAKATTDANGEAYFENLKIGKYQLKEIETQENYVLNTSIFEVEVEYNKTTVKQISNEYKKGNLVVNKVDKDNHKIPLGNVVFDLFSNEYQRVIGTYATDVNGKIQINDLRLGTYKLIETSTGKWYELADDVDININWNQTTEITVENELKKGQVKIIKVDAENNEIKIPGAKFEILDSNNNVLETVVTDENGEALTKKYPIRDYETIKIHEIETNQYYELDDEIKTITLQANTTKEIIFENEKIRGDIEITKISADDNEKTGEKKGTPLKGAIFEVYDENDMLVDTIVTDENGKAKSKLLEYGKYYVKEKSTGSDYYLLNTEKYYVEISENGKTIPVTIENTSIKVEKELPKTGF